MKKVFLVGCPRSGTTWLQLMLFQHPEINSMQETHLFDWYLDPLYKVFEQDTKSKNKRNTGLSGIISYKEFDEIMIFFINKVLYNNTNINKSNTTVLLEKTPEHLRHWELIDRLIPGSYFIHIIRDPRSVVSSMLAAKSQWGSKAAPFGGTVGASYRWVSDVDKGMCLKKIGNRYLETQYEILSSDGPQELKKIFEFIGIDSNDMLCQKIFNDCKISNLQSANKKLKSPWDLSIEPKNFFRKGEIKGWKKDLTVSQIKNIEYITKSFMSKFGYDRSFEISNKSFSIYYYEFLMITIKILKKIVQHLPINYKVVKT